MDKPMREVLEAMDGLRQAVRYDSFHPKNAATAPRALGHLDCCLIKAGVDQDVSETLVVEFIEAQRKVHVATQQIIKAVEG